MIMVLLSEYGEFKLKHEVGFFDMVKTPSMACEITMQVYFISRSFEGRIELHALEDCFGPSSEARK